MVDGWRECRKRRSNRSKNRECSGDVCPGSFDGRKHFDKERDKGEDKYLSGTLPARRRYFFFLRKPCKLRPLSK